MAQNNVIKTQQDSVRCDGGDEGHPAIFLHFGKESEIVCPYCSQKFVREKSAH